MPELYLKIYELYGKGEMETARQIQNEACRIIYKMCTAKGNLYAVQKAIIRLHGAPTRQRPPAHAPSGRRRRIHRAGSGRDDLGCIGKYC